MFHLPLYHIETSLPKIVLILTFLDSANQSTIWLRNFLAFSSLDIAFPMVFGIEYFMIMRLVRLEHFHFS